MALNNFKCNHLVPVHFQQLRLPYTHPIVSLGHIFSLSFVRPCE